jgi:hypothetical protein
MTARIVNCELFGSQYKFFTSQSKYAAFVGGIGSGKTYVGARWSLTQALKNPRIPGLITANTYRQLRDATLQAFFEACDDFGIDYRFNRMDATITLDSGAVIYCRSVDNYNALRGIEVGWFWMDETRDSTKESFDVIKGRLRKGDDLYGRLTTSPNGFDWMYEEFGQAKYQDHELYQARSIDNIFLPKGFVTGLQNTYDPLMAQQELEGKFVNLNAGQVYYCFDRKLHLRREMDLNFTLPVIIGQDFNVDPMSTAIMQQRGDETWIIDEITIRNAGTAETCREIIQRYGTPDQIDYRVYPDASGGSRRTSGKSDFEIFRDHGFKKIYNPAANPSIRDRVNSVNARLKNSKGKVSVLIDDKKCPNIVKSFEQTVYKTGSMEIDKAKNVEHWTDAVGYYIHMELPIIKSNWRQY